MGNKQANDEILKNDFSMVKKLNDSRYGEASLWSIN
jgi:hypothetical protein